MVAPSRTKRYSLASRLIAMLAFIAILAIGLAWWLAGFSLLLGAAAVLALAGLAGPAAVEGGGGIIEFFSSLFELIAEALGMVVDAICSIFSGFS